MWEDDQVRRASFGIIYRDDAPRPAAYAGNKGLAASLEAVWGVSDAESARASVDQLLRSGMHTDQFDVIMLLTSQLSEAPEMRDNFITFMRHLSFARRWDVNETMETFEGCRKLYFSDVFQSVNPPSMPTITLAWDILRIEAFGGRALWLADEITDPEQELTQYNPIFTAALTEPSSPWVRVPLHPRIQD